MTYNSAIYENLNIPKFNPNAISFVNYNPMKEQNLEPFDLDRVPSHHNEGSRVHQGQGFRLLRWWSDDLWHENGHPNATWHEQRKIRSKQRKFYERFWSEYFFKEW